MDEAGADDALMGPSRTNGARAVYRLEHVTEYEYAATVPTSQHVAYLRPRTLPRQRPISHALIVDPTPVRTSERVDYFGNSVARFSVLKPHARLRVSARSLVEVDARGAADAIDPAASPRWEQVQDGLRYAKGRAAGKAAAGNAAARGAAARNIATGDTGTSGPRTSGHGTSDVATGGIAASGPAQFAYASPYIELDGDVAAFARESFTTNRPLLEAAIDLMARIHREFTFDPSATTITTPVSRVLVERRGVCQDLAHLQIACLRSLGLGARYVSGYLLTDPPPGQPRLIGADASHAWLSVHCPVHGWVDLDPTNGVRPDLRHVTLAWGRDYGDVTPLRGVILGGMAHTHTLRVGVSVVPVDDVPVDGDRADPDPAPDPDPNPNRDRDRPSGVTRGPLDVS